MKIQKLSRIVTAALFSAIICVATFIVQIPSPATGGYVNLGDCFVLLAGIYLGCSYGALAAGIGSAIADMLAGYAQYVPATFVIKAIMAVVACAIYKALNSKSNIFAKFACGIAAETIMTAGYFLYEAIILKYGAGAAASILPNAVQGLIGIVAAASLSTALDAAVRRSKVISDIFGKGKKQ